MDRRVRTTAGAIGLFTLVLGMGLALAVLAPTAPSAGPSDDPAPESHEVAQFENETAFVQYVTRGQARTDAGYGSFSGATATRETRTVDQGDAPRPTGEGSQAGGDADAAGSAGGSDAPSPDRIGETNVQVDGIDEPDRVKTDGTYFFYAPDQHRRYVEPQPQPRPEPVEDDVATGRAPPEYYQPNRTYVLATTDADEPTVVAEIAANGDLLLAGDTLVVLGDDAVTGYNVSDPTSPTEAWSKPLQGSLETARAVDDQLYLVTRTPVGLDAPCPREPLGGESAIACEDVYRPDRQVGVDATYATIAITAGSGQVTDTASFVGTDRGTVVYVSHDAIYVTYTERTPRSTLISDFFLEEYDRTPRSVRTRLREIKSYDLQPQSREREVGQAIRQWLKSLPADERKEMRETLDTELSAYLTDRQRDTVTTGIVRVDVDETDLAVDAVGSVPGEPRNQFALDQRNGTLRVTTTIPRLGDADSQADLYTLEADSLDRQGAVTNMGDDQRVYAVRYVGETAYIITYRQVDPLHVVDLSDPANPVERGELELPGYSTYLHPIDDEHVLGIGEEDGEVKAVLFDVSDPTDPTVADDLLLDAHWSAIADSHHAFTIDRKQGVVVLPAGGQGTVIDYTNGTLSEEATIETDYTLSRTRYVDDYLYAFAGPEVAVLDQTDWARVHGLRLDADR